MTTSLAELATLLRDQLQAVHKPRRLSKNENSGEARNRAVVGVKTTLLSLRAALRTSREAQGGTATAAETTAQEISRQTVRLRVSEFHKRQLQTAVDRLQRQEYPALQEVFRSMGREISSFDDQDLLRVLADELTRREDLQRTLSRLQEERSLLEDQIAKDHQLNRQFLDNISALNDVISALAGLLDEPGQVDQEISALPERLTVYYEKLKLLDAAMEVSEGRLVLRLPEEAHLSFGEESVTGTEFVIDSLARKFGKDWMEKFPINTAEMLGAAEKASRRKRFLVQERDGILKNTEILADRKKYKISAVPLGEFGVKFGIVKVGEMKTHAEIWVHEKKFPSVSISKTLQGRTAASSGEVVDPVLSEICDADISELSLSEIFTAVWSRLQL